MLALLSLLAITACRRLRFPDQPADYREFAYVTSGGTNTVSVLDLVKVRQDRVLHVGANPSGVTANPVRNEVYVVNTGTPNSNGSLSVIDTTSNTVTATLPLGRKPYIISVDSKGQRGYVANAGSDTVTILDLVHHRDLATVHTESAPSLARVSPDGHSLVVSNRASGTVSLFAIDSTSQPRLRTIFPHCPGATDIAITPPDPDQSSTKAFIACSAAHTVLVLALAATPDSWAARQDSTATNDRLLARLQVGNAPIHLAIKPDGGEIFVSNFGSDSISEISTTTNEVGGTYKIGTQPTEGVVSADNGTLWVSNFGADSLSLYSIDDGRLAGSVRTGAGPDAIAISADEHLVLAANARSGDVAVIRTRSNHAGPELFTMLPAGARPNAIAIKAFHLK